MREITFNEFKSLVDYSDWGHDFESDSIEKNGSNIEIRKIKSYLEEDISIIINLVKKYIDGIFIEQTYSLENFKVLENEQEVSIDKLSNYLYFDKLD